MKWIVCILFSVLIALVAGCELLPGVSVKPESENEDGKESITDDIESVPVVDGSQDDSFKDQDQMTVEEFKESIMDEIDHQIIMEGGKEDESWDPNRDQDGDGLTNAEEEALGTKPESKDTDADGLTDFEEITGYDYNGAYITTDPLVEDMDTDGLPDGFEKKIIGTNPTVADTDLDGCDDGMEFHGKYQELPSGEVKYTPGTNPLSSSSHPEDCGGCPALTVEPLGGTSEPTLGVQCQVNCHCWTTGATPNPQKYFCNGKTPVVKVCNVESNRCILHPVTETVQVDPLGDDRPYQKAIGNTCLSNCVVDKTDTEAPQCIPLGTQPVADNFYERQGFDCSGLNCVFVK